MRVLSKLTRASIAVTAAVVLVGVGFGVASASSRSAAKPAKPATSVVNAGVAAPKVVAKLKPMWQGDFTEDVPTGTTNLFFHYSCPSPQLAISGSFHISATDPSAFTVHLLGSFPRTDISPLYSQWGWVFVWPAGGSPAGSEIVFDVYCGK